MKYLKYLLATIIVLVLLFIGMGFFTPSVYYEHEVSVEKSIEEAWAVMSDETKLAEWIKGYQKTELVSGVANTVGAVSKIYIDDNGQEMVMQETITDIQPNALIAMTFTMDFMDMDYEMTLQEQAGKTLLRSKSTTSGNGFVAKSMIALMKGAMEAQEQENLNNLKKVIEANTTNYFLDAPLTSEEVTDH
ncbi:MAG: SRPBCC family protein [Bacteroidota bacterium]